MNSFDARVRHTRQIIRRTFLDLLKEKPAANISVTELCAKSQINRTTFYKHYADIFALLDAVEQDALDQLKEVYQPPAFRTTREIFLQALYTLRDMGPDWWVLGSENGDPALFARMAALVYEISFPRMQQNAKSLLPQVQTLLYSYIAQGSGGVIRHWIRSGANTSPEELADFLTHATNSLMIGFLESETSL